MATDYDGASIKGVDLWDMAVRGSPDDKIERTNTMMEEITVVRGRKGTR
jgi:hypothetical protein